MLNTTLPSRRMLAVPNSRLTSAGERQSALKACLYQASVGSRASELAAFPSQKARNVDRATTRMPDRSPILGLIQVDSLVRSPPNTPSQPSLHASNGRLGGGDRRGTDDQVPSVRGGLVVLAPRGGNARHGLADVRRVVIAGESTQRHNTDQPL